MVRADVLAHIRKAEEKAEKMLQEAGKNKAKYIEDAKKEALRIIDDSEKSFGKKQDAALSDFRKKLEKDKETLMDGHKKSLALARKQAEKNVEKAASFLIEKFRQLCAN